MRQKLSILKFQEILPKPQVTDDAAYRTAPEQVKVSGNSFREQTKAFSGAKPES